MAGLLEIGLDVALEGGLEIGAVHRDMVRALADVALQLQIAIVPLIDLLSDQL